MHGEAIVLSAVGVSDAKSTKVQISLSVCLFFFFVSPWKIRGSCELTFVPQSTVFSTILTR